MGAKTGKNGFSRRVVAYYLFFCMVAVTWLSLGVLTTAQGVLAGRATSSCLSRTGQLASAIELDYLRNGGDSVDELIHRAQHEGSLAFCSIVGQDGRYLAHTTAPLVGAPAVEPAGSRLRWGNVDGIRYDDGLHGMINEYRVRLSAGDKRLGTLRLAVVEPSFLTVVSEVADTAPLAVCLPIACVVAGAFLIRRMARPFSSIEQGLIAVARTPHGQPIQLESIASSGAAAIGWNRLAEHLTDKGDVGPRASLDNRLADALAKRSKGQPLDVLQAFREGIAVTDAEGRIEFANAAVATLLAADDDESIADKTLVERLSQTTTDSAAALASPVETPLVAELTPAEGQDRVLRVERQPVDNSAGRAVWSIRDITQQKLAEKSRDQFIDAATHELRTPLANIKAYAETLAACDVDDVEQQKEFYNTINSEATRLGRFVDDLLDISSMEVGSLTIARQNVEVGRLLREAVEKVRPLMEKKSQKFEVAFPPKLGEMHLDKDKISALLVNLLGNASKYTPEGGEVRFEAEMGEGALMLAIVDTGVGISEAELPKVFEKFFRSEDPRVRNEAGTGLGLSLAREIARLHGGDISVESRLGEGSTFTITVPRTPRDMQ